MNLAFGEESLGLLPIKPGTIPEGTKDVVMLRKGFGDVRDGQWLKGLPAFANDQSLVPSAHTVITYDT